MEPLAKLGQFRKRLYSFSPYGYETCIFIGKNCKNWSFAISSSLSLFYNNTLHLHFQVSGASCENGELQTGGLTVRVSFAEAMHFLALWARTKV